MSPDGLDIGLNGRNRKNWSPGKVFPFGKIKRRIRMLEG